MSFEHISSSVQTALANARDAMDRAEMHKENATSIAGRIDTWRDVALYEKEATAAQCASDASDLWQRIARDNAENKRAILATQKFYW